MVINSKVAKRLTEIKLAKSKKSDADEPFLAATYKLCRFLEDVFSETDDRWAVVDLVREWLGQAEREMDGVQYWEMREFIRTFPDRNGV